MFKFYILKCITKFLHSHDNNNKKKKKKHQCSAKHRLRINALVHCMGLSNTTKTKEIDLFGSSPNPLLRTETFEEEFFVAV